MDDTVIAETSPAEVESSCRAAAAACGELSDLAAWPPARRASLLRGVAEILDAHATELAGLADAETALGSLRLGGEVARTTWQLRLLADVVTDGAFLEIIIDHARASSGPQARPDLRRMLQPIGPVAVYAASNFPFAFSVAGGDTAAALAAGCPVVVKAHPGHPRTAQRTAGLVLRACRDAGAPDGTFSLVHGLEAGRVLVTDQRIRAAAFTGSPGGGRALFDLAASRPDPIPFYGELGSINPVFVTAAAVAARGPEIAAGFVGSVTLGNGQFCTKPGLLFLPSGHGLDDALAAAVRSAPVAPMLTPQIGDGFGAGIRDIADIDGVRLLAVAPSPAGPSAGPALDEGFSPDGQPVSDAVPRLFVTTAADVARHPRLARECFGPSSVVAEYRDEAELMEAATAMPGSLTAAIHAESVDEKLSRGLLAILGSRAGRLIWNGWPTGVAVTWAMHHGGPWPATTASVHTSVGPTAIRRFLTPVTFQDTPADLLPDALRDGNPLTLPRRVDGQLVP
jgi:NADP-dependent aldehyde dehydrogenase